MDHAISNPEYLEKFYQDLYQLEPFLTSAKSLQEDAQSIARFLERFVPIANIALIRLNHDEALLDFSIWGYTPDADSVWQRFIDTHLPILVQSYRNARILEDSALMEIIRQVRPTAPQRCYFTYLPIVHENALLGFGVFSKRVENGVWNAAERSMLGILGSMIGVNFSNKAHTESASIQSFVFNGFMENMRANLYVTDPKTDRILFMNSNMKKAYGLNDPEGQICWQVLGRNSDHRCEYCPIETLLTSDSENPSIIWEEHNEDQEKSYENYDSLMRWTDGSIVHFQHSIDVTESKLLTREASMDELTDMLNRRAGKSELEKTLIDARGKGIPVTVAMFDVNSLKKVNDTFGHSEGDSLIATIASTLKSQLRPEDYPFRLSGDEFIAVFPGLKEKQAEKILNATLSALKDKQTILYKPYEIGFCFGLIECPPDSHQTVSNILRQTDARMYEQKRQHHILEAVRTMTDNPLASIALGANFTYDRERLYDALVRSTDDYIFVCNMKTGIFHFPPAMVEEFPIPGEFIENAMAVWEKIVHPDDKDSFLSSFQEVLDGRTRVQSSEYRAKNRKDEWVWLRSRGYLALEEGGEPSLFAGVITNLGKKNKVDHTTGLMNKHEFEQSVNNLLVNRPNASLGIMLLNLDEFRRINDLYDREYGDEVLRITAHKLQAHLPSSASIYRMDGDEFAVLFREGKRTELQTYYDSIKAVFDEQQEYSGKKYFCTISAGAAFYPMDAIHYLDLYKYAGYSLQYAKDRGKDVMFFFTQEIMQHKTRVLELTELLRESVERDYGDFALNFQPQVDAATGQINGAEALVRWSCEKYGPLSPVEFIPLLEKSGLIYPVGRWIFRKAVETCRQWVVEQPEFSISINLSYLQLIHPEFLDFVKKTLEDAGVSPQNIIVELTETNMADNVEALAEVFTQLRAMGIKIAMDDFGTGYSSLDILKMSPADIVKIDRAFVRDICNSRFDATFIKFIVALCHDVDIRVCLEGVESMEEYAIIQPMELDTIQGYLFGRPLSEDEFVQLMSFSGDEKDDKEEPEQ